MQVPQAEPPFAEFREAIASLAKVEPGRIAPSTVLVADLGMDSIALTELVVLMIERYDCDPLVYVADAAWPELTVGQLYDVCAGDGRR